LTDSDRFCLFFGINSGRKAIIDNDSHKRSKGEWELGIINYELGRWGDHCVRVAGGDGEVGKWGIGERFLL